MWLDLTGQIQRESERLRVHPWQSGANLDRRWTFGRCQQGEDRQRALDL